MLVGLNSCQRKCRRGKVLVLLEQSSHGIFLWCYWFGRWIFVSIDRINPIWSNYDIVQIHHMLYPVHHIMYPVHHMMDPPIHHIMDRVHHMMDGVHHMMDLHYIIYCPPLGLKSSLNTVMKLVIWSKFNIFYLMSVGGWNQNYLDCLPQTKKYFKLFVEFLCFQNWLNRCRLVISVTIWINYKKRGPKSRS